MWKKTIVNVLKLALVVGIFYYLIANDRLNFERLLLFGEHPEVLFTLVVVLTFWIVPLAAFRWWLLLRAIGLPVPWTRANLLTWIGNFFNTALPGAVSGDVVKGYYIIQAQEKEGKTPAFATVLIDRFVGLFGLIVMAFFALVFNLNLIAGQPVLIPLVWTICVLFAATILFYVIVIFPFKEEKDPFACLLSNLPGKKWTVNAYRAFKIYQHQKLTLVVTLLMSIILHSSVAFLFFQIARMLGVEELNLATQFIIMPLGLIVVALPITPGGVGVGHLAFGELYRYVGISEGADIFNLFIIVQLTVFLLGVIPYLLHSGEYCLRRDTKTSEEN